MWLLPAARATLFEMWGRGAASWVCVHHTMAPSLLDLLQQLLLLLLLLPLLLLVLGVLRLRPRQVLQLPTIIPLLLLLLVMSW
jgi:hypothetical protein